MAGRRSAGQKGLLPHQLSWYDGCTSDAQGFSAKPERPSHPRPVRQNDVGRLHKPPRMSEVAASEQIGEIPPSVGTYSENSKHAGWRVWTCCPRAEWLQGNGDFHSQTIKMICSVFGQAEVDLFTAMENTHCPIFFSMEDALAPLGRGLNLAPTAGAMESSFMAPRQGLTTLLEARATSTRHLYALKWPVFSDWCTIRNYCKFFLFCKSSWMMSKPRSLWQLLQLITPPLLASWCVGTSWLLSSLKGPRG